jgi:lysophospholipase L1-like esterase
MVGMRISRRSFLRAGASTGALAALAACGDKVYSSASDNQQVPVASVPPAAVGQLPAAEVVPTKFAMVGDSITKASTASLTEALTSRGFVDIDIEAEVSRRIAVGDGKGEPLSGVKTLFTMISEGVAPDVWAIAMGTNDAGKYETREEYADLIQQMMSMIDPRVPILWVDVYNPNQIAGTKMFNKVLHEQADKRGNTTVVSWFDLASDPSEKILRTDHIHPNAKGTEVFAGLVSAALA